MEERQVRKKDKKAQKKKQNGKQKKEIEKGQQYIEEGVTITDNIDSKEYLQTKLEIESNIDTNKIGQYKVKYKVTDSYHNTSQIERTVEIKEKQIINQANKEIYLTFDDGPGPYTEKLLDILKKYNVSATFFVTNARPEYNYLFSRMEREGHTVALHTATHDFSIYADEESYYNDLDKISNAVEKEIGYKPSIIRFPGGSSNTISKKYNIGIMTKLSRGVIENGYEYYDWNIDSGDASGQKLSSAEGTNNVITSLRENRANSVLQHDIKEFSVDAVEDIILEAKEMGYEFKSINNNTPPCKHGVNN